MQVCGDWQSQWMEGLKKNVLYCLLGLCLLEWNFPDAGWLRRSRKLLYTAAGQRQISLLVFLLIVTTVQRLAFLFAGPHASRLCSVSSNTAFVENKAHLSNTVSSFLANVLPFLSLFKRRFAVALPYLSCHGVPFFVACTLWAKFKQEWWLRKIRKQFAVPTNGWITKIHTAGMYNALKCQGIDNAL